MVVPDLQLPELTDADVEFVVDAAAPDASEKERLRRLVTQDGKFRRALIGDGRVLDRVLNDEEIFIKVSPLLYFEVLLSSAAKELETSTHTIERSGSDAVAVFDAPEVTQLLSRQDVLTYLAQMLASFTRVHSFTRPVRIRPGIRRRVRYSDMDVDSLIRFCAETDEPKRLGFYKRIGDVCLFLSGIFHGSRAQHGSPSKTARVPRRTIEDYEREGTRFYRLAEEHPAAQVVRLSEVFGLLGEYFTAARKPLTFIASQYLHSDKHRLFGLQG